MTTVPPFTPMLATPGALPHDDAAWAYEIKWDGVRVLATVDGGRLRLSSRNANDVTAAYPELAGLVDQAPPGPLVLDGEVVALDSAGRSDFGLLQSRMHVRGPAAALVATTPVRLVLFDVLYADGGDLTARTWEQRREVLAGLRLDGPSWATPGEVRGRGADVLRATQEQGLEGIVAKRRRSAYHPGRRSKDWLKIKNIRRTSVVVAGWKPGEGNRHGQIGSLLLGVHPARGDAALEYAGHVGTGFTQASLARLLSLLQPLRRDVAPFSTAVPRADAQGALWVDPVVVAEVDYTEWTREGRLRHPSFKGVRDDYDPADVVRD
jgi:bifunctional non-homologous end joining protein LigD